MKTRVNSTHIVLKVVFISAVFLSKSSYAELTGDIKTAFLNQVQSTCVINQRNADANALISDAAIASYCSCSAIYMSKSPLLTNETITRNYGELSKIIIGNLANQAGRVCLMH